MVLDMDASDRAVLFQLTEEASEDGPESPSPGGWILSSFATGPGDRLIKLWLGDSSFHRKVEMADWPYRTLNGAVITKLDGLRLLTLCSCQSLPLTALSQLPHLYSLRICCANGVALTESVNEDRAVLSKLEQLEISRGFWDESSMRSFMTWVVTCLPILHTLEFKSLVCPSLPPEDWIPTSWGENNDTDISDEDMGGYLVDTAMEVLISPGHEASIRHSLKTLNFVNCGMKNVGLHRLLFKLLPHYPNLSIISICNNSISSLQFLLPSEGEIYPYPISRSLSQLILSGNPIETTFKMCKTEHLAIYRLLDVLCPCLGYIGWFASDPATERRLSINRSGGPILLPQIEKDLVPVLSSAKISKSIPYGLWPIILERAYTMDRLQTFSSKPHYATGVYYLLRNLFVATYNNTQIGGKEKTKFKGKIGRTLVKEAESGKRKRRKLRITNSLTAQSSCSDHLSK